MKTVSRFFATILFPALAVTACEKGGGGNGGGEKEFPPVEITNQVQGAVMAGKAGVIEITGTGFDPDGDYIYVGYDVEGETEPDLVRISTEVMDFTRTRISFGVNVGDTFLDKTVRVYLDRDGYDKMPISGNITFTMPAISEGYIPDAYFRASLNRPKENPWCDGAFDAYGMINVQTAAEVEQVELDGCEAASLEGIELFTSVKRFFAWDMKNVVELDLSKFVAKNVDFRCERALKLEKLVTPPFAHTVLAFKCPNLTEVYAGNSPWLKRLEITAQFQNDPPSAVTMLDIRKNHSGEPNDNPTAENHYAAWGGDSFFDVADNGTIKLDSYYLVNHAIDGRGPSGWVTVYNSWKRGAKIEVYSRVDPYRDELLGTVPMYSDDPEALSPENAVGGVSANKFTVTDPYVGAR